MSKIKNTTSIRHKYHCSDARRSTMQKPPISDHQRIFAAAQRLTQSFEGRKLLQAAANLEAEDLKALANFATSASRGMW